MTVTAEADIPHLSLFSIWVLAYDINKVLTSYLRQDEAHYSFNKKRSSHDTLLVATLVVILTNKDEDFAKEDNILEFRGCITAFGLISFFSIQVYRDW